MRRLLWKEWHERRLWIALWVIAGAVITALGKGQPVCKGSLLENIPQWMMLVVLLAGIAGLGGYGSELYGGRAAFLYSRAVTWKQILAAKLLLGLAAVTGSALISAAAGRLWLPVEYHQLITPASLALGALIMVGFTAVAYLFGLACSLVLPGLAGSLLVAIGWLVLGTTTGSVLNNNDAIFGLLLLLCAPVLALVILARFGVTLHAMARLGRFAGIVIALFALGLALDYTPLSHLVVGKQSSAMSASYFTVNSINPDLSYAAGWNWSGGHSRYSLVRLSDGHVILTDENIDHWWLGNDVWASSTWIDTNSDQIKSELTFYRLCGEKVSTQRLVLSDCMDKNACVLSPDGQRVLIDTSTELQLYNLTTGQSRALVRANRGKLRLLSKRKPNEEYGLYHYWWQSNEVVGYIDLYTGERKLVEGL